MVAEVRPRKLKYQHVFARVYQADRRGKEAAALLEHLLAIESKTPADSYPYQARLRQM